MTLDARVLAQVASETEFWRTDPHERPGADTLPNFVNKAQDVAIFYELIQPVLPIIRRSHRIVEVGGGQGWAACVVKRLAPAASVVLTDAVAEAVQGRGLWERVFDCRLDEAAAAPAQQLPVDSGSVDFLFCFAAAHHFVDQRAALREMKRVLSSDGSCTWFYEPSSPRWLHRAAERRVNIKRPDVPEHVLVPADIERFADEAGWQCRTEYCTSTAHRGRFATVYYLVLATVPVLRRLLPCTAHFHFTHRPGPALAAR